MLFSFEKMALRDALKSNHGARRFAEGLFEYLHGDGELELRFEAWVDAMEGLPQKQTRVLTWPLITAFGFIAQPKQHMFMKPNTMRAAPRVYGFELDYRSRPNWHTYSNLLEVVARVHIDQRDLGPRDMIDIQSCRALRSTTNSRGHFVRGSGIWTVVPCCQASVRIPAIVNSKSTRW